MRSEEEEALADAEVLGDIENAGTAPAVVRSTGDAAVFQGILSAQIAIAKSLLRMVPAPTVIAAEENEASSSCGAWVATEIHEGYPRTLRWCERRSGPCPFPGTTPTDDRPCAVYAGLKPTNLAGYGS